MMKTNNNKITWFLVALISLFYFNSCAQDEFSLQESNINVAGIRLGDDFMTLKNLLGKPDTIVYHNNEVFPEDSYHFVYYSNSYFEIANNRVVSFFICDKFIIGFNPRVLIGEKIDAFLQRYPNIEFNSYVPSGEDYIVYSSVVDNKNTGAFGEYRIIVDKNKFIKRFYYWIPY